MDKPYESTAQISAGRIPAGLPGIAYNSLLTTTSTPAGSAGGRRDLWSMLPRDLATLFGPNVTDLTKEIVREVQWSIPAFADLRLAETISQSVQQAVLHFIDKLADPSTPNSQGAQHFRDLGLQELYDEPIVDALQMAYRVGARVAWRRMAQVGDRAGVSTATLCLLGEAVFAYIDELSAMSVAGHASARIRQVGTVERCRRQLLAAIVDGRGESRGSLHHLAELAQWRLPERLVAVALEIRDDHEPLSEPDRDPRLLVDLEASEPFLVLSEQDLVLLNRLSTSPAGWRMAVGPAVVPDAARESLRWARHTVRLVQCGILPNARVTWFDHHLCVLWLLNDPFLMTDLAERTLAPLARLTNGQRAKLSETLLLWLETRRSAPEIARLLGIHPQTVRYRLKQLEQIFGDQLDDPDARFDIELALRARRALRPAERRR